MPFQRFIRDRRASVVPLFALSIIPLTGLVGAAVDYSRAAAARSAMQSALDSTVLALSKDTETLASGAITGKATTLFNAVFLRPEVQNIALTSSYTSNKGSQLVISGTGTVKTTFMGLMGFSELPVAASATAVWGNTRLRVALVLDNTGSMASSGKMTALKTASKSLITQLQNAARVAEDVYVAIIPYSKDVNVKPGETIPDWVDFTIWDTLNGTCTKSSYTKQSSCVANGGKWTPKAHSTWNGCVMDRDQNWDVLNTAPDSSVKFPAEQYGYCTTAAMALSNDWTALTAKIDAMTPNGSTNNTIGLVWGWHALTTGAPLSAPAKDPDYEYQDVIVLLTDGLNTQNRWNGNGSSQSTAVDARTEKACANVKAAGITLYTVLVMEGNASLLQTCATDSSRYFYLTSANQLVTTFDAIGTQLSKLRLAK
ncbi:pilus assembly protein TadG-related protein [Rhodoplanes sp. TEM]|uniref:Pilus assembly protein TadG-related protein n=1 Tax=Rhodoplanes tepidamans TaxID=200616 RepID=A0ABT5J8A1_RHOTP|nr:MULTISPECIES: pilus assembly protein TadG-related protein [Rhodoplanes]MDC7785849.1 pilus assembly protein TadG-related protein [Rhodoplanes tepidamans]MDC7982766.1 pilus assembly protein TadG-related protein [Rhodoplanes sp. TEM]MDQ0357404.1 Flp pilus assembly protein TadG [Rhodoplanes tepidamans]